MNRPIHTPADADRPVLQQAPVQPLDASGFTASVVGTIAFAAATLAWWRSGHVDPQLWIFTTGTALGIVLIAFTAWHRHRARRQAGPRTAGPTPTL